MPSVADLLSRLFDWAYIPDGKVPLIELGGYLQKVTTYKIDGFQMSQYPITNAHYRLFVDGGGYSTKKYWTSTGWHICKHENWSQPAYWDNPQLNGDDYPAVGVSWYEAIAYCRWLSEVSGEIISLPTEQQWQYAAGGDALLEYPWGNGWDEARCNHHIGQLTPVNQYYSLGDSPFGVADMVGNAHEWTLTIFESGMTDLEDSSERQTRGGVWMGYDNPDEMRVWRRKFRALKPEIRQDDLGFRIVALYD